MLRLINGFGQQLPYRWVPRPPSVGVPLAIRLGGKPCWLCRWSPGLVTDGTAWCSNPGCSCSRTCPWDGCASWEREPGIDDETGLPELAIEIQWTVQQEGGKPRE